VSETANHQDKLQFDAGTRPVLASAALIQGGVLTLRARGEELTVKAPAKFLRALFHWCDGSKTRAELASLAEAKWPLSRFGGFVDAMLRDGVLVDHRFGVDHLLQERRMQRPHREAVHDAREAFFRQAGDVEFVMPGPSVAAKAVAAGALSAQALRGLLAAAQPAQGPGGLRLVVFLREALDFIEAGAYEVHGVGTEIFLRPFGKAATAGAYRGFPNLYDFFRSQALLAFFTGTDLPDCPLDVALVAGGAALQRLASAAAAGGIACVEAGASYANALSVLCGPDKHLFVTAAFLGGVPPSHGDRGKTALLRPVIRIIDYGESGGDCLAAARVAHGDGTVRTGWGRSGDPRVACAKALSEAVERHAYCEPPDGLLFEKGSRLAGKLKPEELVRFSDRQYRDKAAMGIRPYLDDAERFWVAATCLGSDEKVFVPADCVFFGRYLPRAAELGMLMRQTSSGCASDVSLEVAIERAGLEVIERDAFVRHWLAQRPGGLLAPGSLPSNIQAKAHDWERRGCALRIGVFTGEWGPVIFAAIVSVSHRFSVIAASCSGPAEASMAHAIGEAEIAGFSALEFKAPRRLSPKSVLTPGDHGLLYRQAAHYSKMSAIIEGGEVGGFAQLREKWPASLGERLKAAPRSSKAVWVDVTQPGAPLSFDGRVIRTVRVLVPGAIPMAFGHDGLPLGMGEKIASGGKFPHPFN
jgi:ribosomal protein S12 methylthiotransferase accessory factor